MAEHDEPLLRAVVQVAPDPPALLVRGLDGAGAGRGERLLVAAALELRAGAGGEDAQRLQLGGLGRKRRAARDHAEVADRAATSVAQREREVAVELVLRAGTGPAGSAGGRRA